MINKYQASLILKLTNGKHFVQVRDSVRDAIFKFPGTLSLFGGKIEIAENGKKGFLREMKEEIKGLDFETIDFEHRVYRWKEDLERVDQEINEAFEGNFSNFKGFGYDELVPREALGEDRGIKISFRDLICAVEEDHYFASEVSPNLIEGLEIMEAKAIIIPKEMCQWGIFYPTDKLALMHDYAMDKLKQKVC